MLNAPVVARSDAELSELLQRPRLMVVFTSPTCGPCRLLKPHLPLIAAEYGKRGLTVIEADQDAVPGHLQNFSAATGQMGFPLVVLLRGDEVHHAFTGFQPLAATKQRVEALLG